MNYQPINDQFNVELIHIIDAKIKQLVLQKDCSANLNRQKNHLKKQTEKITLINSLRVGDFIHQKLQHLTQK